MVTNELGVGLGVCYSNHESVAKAMETGEGVYWSRKRGLWHKGLTSGNTQKLFSIHFDCDRDLLVFRVRQDGAVESLRRRLIVSNRMIRASVIVEATHAWLPTVAWDSSSAC